MTAPQNVIGIVLAAGRGTRMRSDRPKVLFDVCGLPLVAHPIRALAGAGCRSAVVVTGFRADRVESALGDDPSLVRALPLRFTRQDPPRGTGDAVRVALSAMDDEVGTLLIVNGDLPLITSGTLGRFLSAHRERGAAMTILSLEREDPTGYGRLVRGADGAVERIVEEKDATDAERAIRDVNGGLYAVEISALRPALSGWCEAEEKRLAAGGPGPDEIYFPPVIGEIARAGGVVGDWILPEEGGEDLQQINDRCELAVASDRLRHRIIQEHQRNGVTIVDPGQTWVECDVEIGPDTTIHPSTVLRRGVRIGAECAVGPFAHLRAGTVLDDDVQIGNFVEVKQTRLGRGTRAKHLTYLGNGEVGERVNIGAGTVFANYDGVRKSTTTVGDGAFIGSGSIIVAPAQIGAGSRTGAGAVLPGGRSVPAGETVVGVPARPHPKREAPAEDTEDRSGAAPAGECASDA